MGQAVCTSGRKQLPRGRRSRLRPRDLARGGFSILGWFACEIGVHSRSPFPTDPTGVAHLPRVHIARRWLRIIQRADRLSPRLLASYEKKTIAHKVRE